SNSWPRSRRASVRREPRRAIRRGASMPDTPMAAETVTITGHNGDEIEAYFARPTTDGPRPGVVVIHHMPGYDRSTKEIVRTFAVYGYDAICPNLHHRYAPGAKAT